LRRDVLSATREKTKIRLYTGAYCPYCVRVRRELDRLELDYEVVRTDADRREEVMRLSGQRKIPILTIGDEVLVDSPHILRELRKRYAAQRYGRPSAGSGAFSPPESPLSCSRT
jgi:glutaredoxin 3